MATANVDGIGVPGRQTLLAELAATSAAVAQASARNRKTALLAELIGRLGPGEIEAAIGFLIARPRQGRIGVGWAAVSRLDVPAATTAGITVLDLDALLSELAVTTGAGSIAARDLVLAQLMARATAAEHAMVRQILTGELRQGASAGVVTAAVAQAAAVKLGVLRRAVMLTGDLGVASRIALTVGEEALASVQLEVGRPIEPMLASTSESVADAVTALGTVSVEWKLDGARIQVHRTGNDVRIFTRNLNEITSRLPGVAAIVRAFPADRVVLDGEILGLVDDGSPQPFQDTISSFSDQHEGSSFSDQHEGPNRGATMTPFFFDIMHLNGDATIDLPLTERTRLLNEVAGPHCVPAVITDDVALAESHASASLAAGHEGVMVKAIDGTYEAGRRGKSWRKVKPVITVDLLVLGAEWGHGRRSGKLSNLHLGARDAETGDFVMVGKTFKGLTDELLAWQTTRFLELKERESASGHTVFIRPELVVEIAIDGVQRSTRYPGGVALRFARVKGYRPDRDPHSVESIAALQSLLT